MCYAIYAAMILLFAVYSDHLLEPLALSTSAAPDEWITIALGWEIVPTLWPLLLLTAVVSSMLTYLVTRRILGGK